MKRIDQLKEQLKTLSDLLEQVELEHTAREKELEQRLMLIGLELERQGKAVKEAQQKASDLCHAIEEAGASPELTRCSILASSLRARLT